MTTIITKPGMMYFSIKQCQLSHEVYVAFYFYNKQSLENH